MREGGKDSSMRNMAASAVLIAIIGACLFWSVPARAGDLRSEVMNGPLEKKLAFLNDPAAPAAKLDPVLVARFRSLLDQLVKLTRRKMNARLLTGHPKSGRLRIVWRKGNATQYDGGD